MLNFCLFLWLRLVCLLIIYSYDQIKGSYSPIKRRKLFEN